MTNQDFGKKGRPTPKRKDSEARLKVNSLSPATTKEEKKRQRELSRSTRQANRIAYMRGDESALPLRDKGPVKKFIRDYVDSHRSMGEYFLPLIMGVLVLTIIPNKFVQFFAIVFMYIAMLFTLLSGYFISRSIKREVTKRFPGQNLKGLGTYGWLRSTQMRRMRAPAPQYKRGAEI